MDLEEISDEELEEEKQQAKFSVCDALTINWDAIASVPRPQPVKRSSATARYSFMSSNNIICFFGITARRISSDNYQ